MRKQQSSAGMHTILDVIRMINAGACDMLGLCTRPVVALGQVGLAPQSTVLSLVEGGWLVGIVGTISALLIGISLGSLMAMCCGKGMAKLVAGIFLVDCILQLPQVILVNFAIDASMYMCVCLCAGGCVCVCECVCVCV